MYRAILDQHFNRLGVHSDMRNSNIDGDMCIRLGKVKSGCNWHDNDGNDGNDMLIGAHHYRVLQGAYRSAGGGTKNKKQGVCD